MFNNPLNLVGIILMLAAISLCALPVVRPQLFRREDIMLISGFLISGLILLFQDRWYDKELVQFNLILLAITAIFYTIESIRWRSKNIQ